MTHLVINNRPMLSLFWNYWYWKFVAVPGTSQTTSQRCQDLRIQMPCQSLETSSNRVHAGLRVFWLEWGKIHSNIFLLTLAPIFSSSGSFKGNVRKHETMQNKMMKNSGQTLACWNQQVITWMRKFSSMSTIFHFFLSSTTSYCLQLTVLIT